MRNFDPAALLVARARTAEEGAIIRMAQKARDLRALGRDVVSLTVGEPDFDTPAHIQEAATRAMREGFTHYAPVQGLAELRAAISTKLKSENGLDYAASGICLANGAKQAIANAVLATVDAGDEAIVLAPYWVSYEIVVRFAGGTPVIVPAGVEEDYKAPASRIAAAVSDRTKLLILNSPCNPTGAMWSRKELEAIVAVVTAHPRMMVLSDEIYEYIRFDGAMASIGALAGMASRTITVNGFSKGFAMTGWRLGYAAAPDPIARAIVRMQSTLTAGANSFVQRAALAALEAPRDAVEAMRRRYRARRDTVVAALRAMPGVRIGDIPATFYAFPDVSAFIGRRFATSEPLCDWLLDAHGLAVVPGTAFGAPGSLRLSFAAGEAEIEKGLTRLKTALAGL